MKVVIIDTCCANLFSVIAAIRRLGYQPEVSHDAKVILQANKLFLPGVGTAYAAMEQLYNRKLIDLIKLMTQPVLGICLGMQLLGSSSDENGGVTTLGIIKASVKRISNFNMPWPHMGWNKVTQKATNNRLFHGIPEDSYFYFVHGYAMQLCDATIAQANYGKPFTAAIAQDNFFGVQFHPERSGTVGQQLLKNFLEM
ncbi:imidazole glycerol phosphate synthase subunit HisH [Candidatus Palibaumannia cicadellinicola]|uniref:Imidazole glycerol phosphate synthase subunit HisH n=1 Tax=Baumannia cicadellinicola subsp. Homalodisca coagulata TaxID=374463 RepID=Q1LT70_BAUCH|nr:imidazole glycerol phosphate synthase subunit HisH [Candidatus Baumannia cicadellinicola]ABF13911.1 imidazole glycerol phosphate synthase, glutamine amidotransferase subunit [Baumannia cicadellinicola str. Hc (Homalodisca coagulata)]MCJ7462116.1 imidazole glycerol phosphate synthase subunit HisH [Candidatus Baumannia cicadellinicola]MCJ7462689.1 imidazole glycerol phosphate synthase subunit HisH [Candidatus Baumannia cicadellinicola]